MFSSIGTFRADLDALIKPRIPEAWRTVPKLSGALASLTPVVYFEFTDLATSDPTGPLPRGTVYASCDLLITDPDTADESDVDGHIGTLIRALDGHDDINWDTARKQRLKAGPFAWRISTHALVSTDLPEQE